MPALSHLAIWRALAAEAGAEDRDAWWYVLEDDARVANCADGGSLRALIGVPDDADVLALGRGAADDAAAGDGGACARGGAPWVATAGGDLVHAGAGYAGEHFRVHAYVDPPSDIYRRPPGKTNRCLPSSDGAEAS